MKRMDYGKETFEKVSVCGIICEFSDMRIDGSTVPEGKFQYEVAGDDESGEEPVRVQLGVLVNFFGTLICDKQLPIDAEGILWLKDDDFVWL